MEELKCGLRPKWWAATKERITSTLANRSWIERGRRYESDVTELTQECERLRALVKATDDNLTAVQKRSTEQKDELRGLRWLGMQSGIWQVWTGIAREIWRANIKFGTPEQLATTRLDGTGLKDWTQRCAEATAICDELKDNAPWALVLEEEMLEVCQETEPSKMRPELLQVAATSIRWHLTLDAREAHGETAQEQSAATMSESVASSAQL